MDGFRIDAISTMFETEEVLGMDEPRSNKPGYTDVGDAIVFVQEYVTRKIFL